MHRTALNVLRPMTIAAAAMFALSMPAASAEGDNEIWKGLQKDVFAAKEITDGTGMMTMEAPIRAEDASLVPITIRMPASFAPNVKTLTLVVDKNPSPVVGTFNYGAAAGRGDRMLSMRIRIDQYSDVRAIAETNDGKLYMISKFVKASGGCSAPASKDAEEAAKIMGKMQIKTALTKSPDGLSQEGQLMIKHPNNSGMQMDQLTGLYSKAHYVNRIEVKSGDKLVFAMVGGISISEDPNIRFTYEGSPADPLEVKAEDSEGKMYAGKSSPSAS